jgi:hypothetical protein
MGDVQLGQLMVRRTGTVVGYVSSDPPGISCGSRCSAVFPFGTIVTLSPTVGLEGSFGGWAGACSGTRACTVTIDAEQSVSATFACTGSRQFASAGGYETFKIPACSRSVFVDASGAQGGNEGGKGARIRGAFAKNTLPSSDLIVLVGAMGIADYGGGGSFVYVNATDAVPLVAAGGGGGTSEACSGGPGSATQTPTTGVGGSGNGTSGSNGEGGGAGAYSASEPLLQIGAGGAGWRGDGLPRFLGGSAPRNGAFSGGASGNQSGGHSSGGGGGGGFNGGGGGNAFNNGAGGCGGGGGSYNSGTDQTNNSDAREGNGLVTISWIE